MVRRSEVLKSIKVCAEEKSCLKCAYRMLGSAMCVRALMKDAAHLIEQDDRKIDTLMQEVVKLKTQGKNNGRNA